MLENHKMVGLTRKSMLVKLILCYVQVRTLHNEGKQGINQQIFNRKSDPISIRTEDE